jgi:putative membrane protein
MGVVALAAAATLACSDGTQDRNNAAGNPNATPANPAATPANPTVGTSGENGDVQEFVTKAANVNMAEIQLGRLAEQKAQSPQVKDFARQMVEDHTKANNDLEQIARAQNIPLPTELDKDHQDVMQKLQGLSGADFDREYMDAMVDGHQDAVDLLKDHADDLKDNAQQGAPVGTSGSAPAKVQADQWAANTLPTVQSHLDMAKRIQEQLQNQK